MTKDFHILKETINSAIQNSNMEIGAVYYVIKDVYRDMENLYYARINQELLQESNENIAKEKEQCLEESTEK